MPNGVIKMDLCMENKHHTSYNVKAFGILFANCYNIIIVNVRLENCYNNQLRRDKYVFTY